MIKRNFIIAILLVFIGISCSGCIDYSESDIEDLETQISNLEEENENLKDENQELKDKLDNINQMVLYRDYNYNDLLDDIETESAY